MSKQPQNFIEKITLDWNEKGPCVFTATAKVPGEVITAAEKETLRYASAQAKIPGFRQGQAPANLVAQRYKDTIVAEVREAIIGAVFRKVQAEDTKGMISFSIPNNQELDFVSGKDAEFVCEIEVTPTFDLPDYKNMEVAVRGEEVTQEAIDKRITAIRDAFGEFVKIEGALQKHDLVQVAYSADVSLPEDAHGALRAMVNAKTTWVWLGDNERIPGMTEAVIGKNIGEDFTFEATFPADAAEPFLAGKKLTYTCNIKDAQRRAPLTDDKVLLERMGMDSMDAFKARVEGDLKQEADDRAHTEILEKISEKLEEVVPAFPMPAGVIGRKTMQHLREISQEIVKTEADVAAFHAARAEHEAEAKKRAERTSHLFFILAAIAKAEKITVSAEDFQARVDMISNHLQQTVEQTKKVIEERGIEQDIVDDLLGNKVLEALSKIVKVTRV